MRAKATAKELILKYQRLLKDDPQHENLQALLEMAYALGHAEGVQRSGELVSEAFARVAV